MRNIRIAEKKVDKVAAFIGNNLVRFSTICYHLNKEFKAMSVKFRSKAWHSYSISGFFNPYRDRDEGDSRYNILITYDRNEKTPAITPDKEFWEEILLVLVHEFRHGYQNNQYNKTQPQYSKFNNVSKFIRAELNYLTEPNELDAYAYETAYAMKNNLTDLENYWTVERYRIFVEAYAPKLYKKFLKKVYLFSHK